MTASVDVTVHGWSGVQRVVVLLTSRAYVVCSFEASASTSASASSARWQVCIALRCADADLPLLRARLERLPAVTAVLTSPGTDAPAS